MHAPKISHFDFSAKLHTVSKGVYPLEHFERDKNWLYFTRPMPGHPNFSAMTAYILPELGLQVTRWGHRPASPYTWYDYYVDILMCEVGERGWTTKDLYLDVVVLEQRAALTNDTDEYLGAIREGHLTRAEAEFALTAMHRMLNGLGECGHSMRTWLKREVGLEMAF